MLLEVYGMNSHAAAQSSPPGMSTMAKDFQYSVVAAHAFRRPFLIGSPALMLNATAGMIPNSQPNASKATPTPPGSNLDASHAMTDTPGNIHKIRNMAP